VRPRKTPGEGGENAEGGTHRSLKSSRLSIAQTLSCLSSPAVVRCSYAESTAAQRTGPDFSTASSFASSRETVERSSSPELGVSSRQVVEGFPRDVLCVQNLNVRARNYYSFVFSIE
jgi:hypothetical protein